MQLKFHIVCWNMIESLAGWLGFFVSIQNNQFFKASSENRLHWFSINRMFLPAVVKLIGGQEAKNDESLQHTTLFLYFQMGLWCRDEWRETEIAMDTSLNWLFVRPIHVIYDTVKCSNMINKCFSLFCGHQSVRTCVIKCLG